MAGEVGMSGACNAKEFASLISELAIGSKSYPQVGRKHKGKKGRKEFLPVSSKEDFLL